MKNQTTAMNDDNPSNTYRQARQKSTNDQIALLRGFNFQSQENSMANFSLLDRIDSIVNVPKKVSSMTKKWDQAYDEYLRNIQRNNYHYQKQSNSNKNKLEEKGISMQLEDNILFNNKNAATNNNINNTQQSKLVVNKKKNSIALSAKNSSNTTINNKNGNVSARKNSLSTR